MEKIFVPKNLYLLEVELLYCMVWSKFKVVPESEKSCVWRFCPTLLTTDGSDGYGDSGVDTVKIYPDEVSVAYVLWFLNNWRNKIESFLA